MADSAERMRRMRAKHKDKGKCSTCCVRDPKPPKETEDGRVIIYRSCDICLLRKRSKRKDNK